MESLIQILALNLAVVAAMMVIGWLISLWYKNVTIADSLWGTGFVLAAICSPSLGGCHGRTGESMSQV